MFKVFSSSINQTEAPLPQTEGVFMQKKCMQRVGWLAACVNGQSVVQVAQKRVGKTLHKDVSSDAVSHLYIRHRSQNGPKVRRDLSMLKRCSVSVSTHQPLFGFLKPDHLLHQATKL